MLPTLCTVERFARGGIMAWTVTALLFALWVLAIASGATLGNWAYLLLVFALVSLVVAVAGMLGRRRGAYP
jgi:membrane protein implicated in regulation of membrane protease activity